MNTADNNATLTVSTPLVAEINSFHSEVMEHCKGAEARIGAALTAAWHAGGLLHAAKQQVRKNMGHGVWSDWLKRNFAGSERTAQRYMKLAKTVTAVSDLQGLSFRQAYQRLGLRVEQRGTAEVIEVPKPAGPGTMVRRILAKLPTEEEFTRLPEIKRERLLADLAPLHRRLGALYRTG